MKSLAAAPRHRQRQIVLTACLAVALMAGQAVGGEIVGAPIDLSAFVHEGLLPGGTIFEDTHSVTGALTTPKQSAEYLYLASKGENLSGRSTNIKGAFASVAGRIRRQRRRRGHGLDRRKSEQHQSGVDRAARLPGHLEAELHL